MNHFGQQASVLSFAQLTHDDPVQEAVLDQQ